VAHKGRTRTFVGGMVGGRSKQSKYLHRVAKNACKKAGELVSEPGVQRPVRLVRGTIKPQMTAWHWPQGAPTPSLVVTGSPAVASAWQGPFPGSHSRLHVIRCDVAQGVDLVAGGEISGQATQDTTPAWLPAEPSHVTGHSLGDFAHARMTCGQS